MTDHEQNGRADLARELMEGFASRTGLLEGGPPKRYLWTDAFAVCNFLDLAKRTGEDRYIGLARRLVDLVHRTLGRHRDDDQRRGWISGLGEEEGARHPTSGGLRIGKELPERAPGEPADPRLEWEQDGQYFHYLTQWMHALHQLSVATGDAVVLRWSLELAKVAHRAFTCAATPAGPLRMVWKMSIDLRRPLVPSMGHHDPLDALVTYLELQNAATRLAARDPSIDLPDLEAEIAEAAGLCEGRSWATDDALGIGGLAVAAARLARMVEQSHERSALLSRLLEETGVSLRAFARAGTLRFPAEHRLAFRELGLAIGLHGIDLVRELGLAGGPAGVRLDALRAFLPLAGRIEAFWIDPASRRSATWTAHREINAVMLATSLSPAGYLRL